MGRDMVTSGRGHSDQWGGGGLVGGDMVTVGELVGRDMVTSGGASGKRHGDQWGG